MIDNFLRLSTLFDFYGALLTKKQQDCLKMHLYEDWSLSEIAAALDISRQAAYDMIHRCTATLEKYESKLQLINKSKKRQTSLNSILTDVNTLQSAISNKRLHIIEDKLRELLNS
ncbi:YlxM family DNA-binding protein [Pectinatus brassicae]|uniref:UPF0122 protein HNR32_001635 n=1 Tax=Pectinatus brassicae TaxID=862415 RepID=A0A840UH92_9FIRM|nr:sigma factor-like helix-turn-helix DNA-binding protein [Pectinatus brassicae]MBB5336486.1 hypothetical protein [Pectinatus brassicae]